MGERRTEEGEGDDSDDQATAMNISGLGDLVAFQEAAGYDFQGQDFVGSLEDR